jgi:predicted AlkP superfamily pyrophosphatase or phosphodiesterase
MLRLALAAALAAALLAPAGARAEPLAGVSSRGAAETVVLMLFDGVPESALDLAPTPHLDRLRREGAATGRMLPVFPSISLINGVTVSTGCWPESHGIVTNRFLDPERGAYDHHRDADWLTGCQHLHEVAERQGVPAAALGWYGAESGARGALASVVRVEASWPEYPDDRTRARQVAEQLARTDAERPRLVLAYFQGPDGAQHFQGMESEAARDAVAAMDDAVGIVLDAVERGPHAGRTAVLVTTDHGMRPVTHLINIQRILIRHDIPARPVSSGTTAFLYFDDPAAVGAAAAKLAGYEAFEVLRRDALPDYARLGQGPRVGELIVSAKPPHFIEDADTWPRWLRWLARWGPEISPAGPFLKATHGYPPETPGMAGILYAWGAGIAAGRSVGETRAVDVHPTVAHLLGIAPGNHLDGRVAAEFLDGDGR